MSLDPNAALAHSRAGVARGPGRPNRPRAAFRRLPAWAHLRLTSGQELKTAQFLWRMGPYGADVPAGIEFLTLGGDMQAGEVNPRIEAAVYRWGRRLECWLIGLFVLPGRSRPGGGLDSP